jgi:predicted O-methyltransferase YrrM
MTNFTEDWFSHNIKLFERFLKHLNNLRILEIGSFEGMSSLWMINNLKPSKIVLVDPGLTKGSNDTLKSNLSGLELCH